MKKNSTIKFLVSNLEGTKEAFVILLISSILVIIPQVSMPIIRQMMVDNVFTGLNTAWFPALVAAALTLVAFEFIVRIITCGTWRHQMRMSSSSVSRTVWHSLRLPVSYFYDKYAGDLASRALIGSDLAGILVNKFFWMFGSILLAVVYLFFMIKYSLWLSVFGIAHILLTIFIIRGVHKRQVNDSRRMQNLNGELEGFTTVVVDNIEAIKGTSSERAFFRRWSAVFKDAQNATVHYLSRSAKVELIPSILEAVADVFVLGVGAWYVINGHLTVGMLMAFQSFMASSVSPVTHLVNDIQRLAQIKAKCERMSGILDAECDVEDTDLQQKVKVENGKLRGHLQMKNVTFGYDSKAEPLITDFNLTLEPGKSVAFVGPSGCGKSTLTNLISGLYRPWSGEILFDGKSQDEIERGVFVNSVAIINQTIAMFDGTVADNVRMWDNSIEDFAMILACHDAQIHEQIASRPGAYESQVENSGVNFSGGQRQRIEIASAFAKEPTLILMDEGTSALDAVTEAKLMATLKNMGVSLVMVAHRLSTIRDCDEIIVMDHGHIVERGTHDQLIARGGFYKKLIDNN